MNEYAMDPANTGADPSEISSAEVLRLEGIKKYFPLKGGFLTRTKGNVKAVDGINLTLMDGDIYGLAGESGCGKTTLGYIASGFVPPTDGKIYLRDKVADKKSIKRITVEDVQLIFQDVSGALNPRWMLKDIIAEPLAILGVKKKVRQEKTEEVMHQVGLTLEYIDAFPHELSGGQRQRVAIARAMITNPSLIVCDEPFSALDVSVQAQIISLLIKLKETSNLTYLIISHDLALLEYLCNAIAVMYLGMIVEKANPSSRLFENPLHPYSKGLIESFLFADPQRQRIDTIEILSGEVPSPVDPPQGCRFHPRCKIQESRCKNEVPVLREVEPGHEVACHLV